MRLDLTSLVGTELPRLSSRFFPDLLFRLPARERVAYLTFDDGPTPGLTSRLIDILARHEVRASFFLIGSHAERDPGLVRALHEAGHTIGNHTFTHPDAWRTRSGSVLDELDRTTALLEDVLQTAIRWMRPPYGRFTRSMRDWCLARRQQLTMWDVGPGDYLDHATRRVVERRVLHYVRRGSIVVLHDSPRTLDVVPALLERLLPRLRDEGWRFPALPPQPAS